MYQVKPPKFTNLKTEKNVKTSKVDLQWVVVYYIEVMY